MCFYFFSHYTTLDLEHFVKSSALYVHPAICIMAHDFDRQDWKKGPLDICIMVLYRVHMLGGGGGGGGI